MAASKALERRGGAAIRAAADMSDLRVRSRVRVWIESLGRQVEADRFARPTRIRLDFRTRPLGEVVDALNDRHDLECSRLRLGIDRHSRDQGKRPLQGRGCCLDGLLFGHLA